MSKTRDIEELPFREKINPVFSGMKGSHPVDNADCRSHWKRDKFKRAKPKSKEH